MDMFKESSWVLMAMPFYAAAIILEIVASNVVSKKVYTFRGVMENIYLSATNMALDILIRGVALWVLSTAFQFSIIHWSGGVVYWFALLMGEDFIYYWLHRVDHRCRLFWAVHVTHHSSVEFNLTTGFRSSVFQPLYRFLYFIPLALFGFQPMDIFLMYSMTQLYGLLIHTQLIRKLGFIEWFMVTPSHHRVHHGSNANYLDKNYGMVFIIWDRLFGTFTPETEDIKYGLNKPHKASDAVSLITHEWKQLAEDVGRSEGWADKVKCIIGPPDWVTNKDKTRD